MAEYGRTCAVKQYRPVYIFHQFYSPCMFHRQHYENKNMQDMKPFVVIHNFPGSHFETPARQEYSLGFRLLFMWTRSWEFLHPIAPDIKIAQLCNRVGFIIIKVSPSINCMFCVTQHFSCSSSPDSHHQPNQF